MSLVGRDPQESSSPTCVPAQDNPTVRTSHYNKVIDVLEWGQRRPPRWSGVMDRLRKLSQLSLDKTRETFGRLQSTQGNRGTGWNTRNSDQMEGNKAIHHEGDRILRDAQCDISILGGVRGNLRPWPTWSNSICFEQHVGAMTLENSCNLNFFMNL